jgi:large subunit ribosomal protein L21
MYAVFETGGKQYRAGAGDTVTVEKLDAEAGKPVTFNRVLLVNQDGQVTVGSPVVDQAAVVADVVEHKRGPKLIAFKMKRRKGYRRKVGHRQDLTVVKITDIQTGGKPAKPKAAKKAAQKEEAEAPAEKQAENKE